jgi:hypothetical protein
MGASGANPRRSGGGPPGLPTAKGPLGVPISWRSGRGPPPAVPAVGRWDRRDRPRAATDLAPDGKLGVPEPTQLRLVLPPGAAGNPRGLRPSASRPPAWRAIGRRPAGGRLGAAAAGLEARQVSQSQAAPEPDHGRAGSGHWRACRNGPRALSSLGFAERKCQRLEMGISMPATAGAAPAVGRSTPADRAPRLHRHCRCAAPAWSPVASTRPFPHGSPTPSRRWVGRCSIPPVPWSTGLSGTCTRSTPGLPTTGALPC